SDFPRTAARPRGPRPGPAHPAPPAPLPRPRVEGKFLARGGERFRVKGVTYGPFAPDAAGSPFPDPARAAHDFAGMRDAGINTIRTYHVPPDWLLRLAAEAGLGVLVDVPWTKHLCFLDSADAQAEARRAVRAAAVRGREHGSVLAYSIGNEV